MSLFALPRSAARTHTTRRVLPSVARSLLVAAVVFGAAGAFALSGGSATTDTDADLVGLLRFMALLKSALAVGLLGAIWWRLASPIDAWRLAAYAATNAAMSSGPVLIWTMSHLGLGALLLHAGLLAAALLLWRDPAVASQLSALVARRRR